VEVELQGKDMRVAMEAIMLVVVEVELEV